MAWQSTFGSRIERRVAIPLILALSILVLAVTMLAMDQIRQQAMLYSQAHLQRIAKDYGMLIAERLKDRVAYNASFPGTPLDKPKLTWSGGDQLLLSGLVQDIEVQHKVSIAQLTYDVEDISGLKRCVSLGATPRCGEVSADDLVRTWKLRLVSLFDTDLVFLVTVTQKRQDALAGIETITSLLPFIIALFAAFIGHAVVLYLRQRFKPVPELSKAIKNIEAGDFTYRVNIDSNDEFAQLGAALNDLSAELGGSFAFLKRLSDIDQLILSSTDAHGVVDAVTTAAVENTGVTGAVVILVSPNDEVELRGCIAGTPTTRTVTNYDSILNTEPEVEDFDNSVCYPIFRDRKAAGWLVADAPDAYDDDRMHELARKVSVGVTNISRSETLFQQATYDSLTGLLNRLAFLHQLSRRIGETKRANAKGALLFLDLDDFKNINDVQGHTTGDELLCVVADRLVGCLRDSDIVARLGGDEFAISLASFNDDYGLAALLHRIISAISQPIKIGQFEHIVHCSVGVCLYPQDGNETETLLKNADMAMYRAKAMSGSAFVFFNESLNQETERRVLVERRLRLALREKRLDLFLQPKMHIESGRIDSFEALVRWQDDELGWVKPMEFVEVAERAGLIGDLTESVIEQTALILNKNLNVQSVAVNISPVLLAQPQFVDRFLAILQTYGCDPSRLEIEITESVFVGDPVAVTRKLTNLKKHGIRVSLDDFGTGFSSLNLLRQLPLDALKIDKSFIDDIPDDRQAMLLVSKIVEIANGLDIEVIAEGIEKMSQLTALTNIHCNFAQGFLICHPLPATQVLAMLSQHKDWRGIPAEAS